jgi:hypothetical protein
MNRLQTELQRLYLPHTAPTAAAGLGNSTAHPLIGPGGTVRALVLGLARPVSWEALAQVWRGVQVDLELPAPAIAVSGSDGLALWFSLAEPATVAQAQQFLALLCRRYLQDIAPQRLSLMPAAQGSSPGTAAATHATTHAPLVPAPVGEGGNWSAFVAPDLAPVFTDTPWLDTEPNPEGQADLLCRLGSITPTALDAALARLTPCAPQANPAPGPTPPAASGSNLDPQRFLLQVMNDDSVALSLRIEAAKALLTCTHPPRP